MKGVDLNSIVGNVWFEGIMASLIASSIWYFFNKENKNMLDINNPQTQTNTQNQNVTQNVNLHLPQLQKEVTEKTATPDKVSFFKQNLKILFIDDNDLKDKIKNLKGYGWKNVNQIFDAGDVFSQEIRDANVIFVDYKGIAKRENGQGLAVLSALRKNYGNSKWLVLFTAHNVPVDAFDRGADKHMAKNSSPYELEHIIIEGALHLE